MTYPEEDSGDENDDSVVSLSMTFIPLKGHLFGNEFEYIAKNNQRRIAAEKCKSNRYGVNGNSGEVAINSVAATITQEKFTYMYEDENDVDDHDDDRSKNPIDFDTGGAEYDDGEDDDHDIGGNLYDDTDNATQSQGDGASMG